MAALSFLTSTPGNAEASQIIGTVNSLIQEINTAFSLGGEGPGALGRAIYLPANSSAINALSIAGGASGTGVTLTVGGDSSETNSSIVLSGKGTGDLFLGGSGSSASAILLLDGAASLVNGFTIAGGTSGGGTPTITASGSDSNIAIGIAAKGTGNTWFGANSLAATLTLTGVASQANGFTLTGTTSGANSIGIAATGSDSNITVGMSPKGTGNWFVGASSASAGLTVAGVASQANGLTITGTTSGGGIATLSASGSDTNIDLVVVPKGSGTLRFNTTTAFTANSNVALSLTALGPAALISSTISKWLTVKDSAGGLFYIPCFH